MAEVRCLGERHGDRWSLYHGDCVDVLRQLPDNSVDFSIYSPPFSELYIYGTSAADMGNSANDTEFMAHYAIFAGQLTRVLRPGRIVAVHCKDLVFYRNQGGRAGLRDFPGMLIKAHQDAGLTFHSRVTVWRCPVREMTKTKAHGLLYKQLRANSSFSRQGLPEYILAFRKWAEDGDEIAPVTKTKDDFPLPWWQEAASPVWMDTRETDVLNSVRGPNDEKHICPLPFDLIERSIALWSTPNDVVLSPFAGIGSEGHVAMKMRRRFVGVELHDKYFEQAARNIDAAGRQEVMNFA